MNNNNPIQAYGTLCSLFYDAMQMYASDQEVDFFAAFIEQYPGRVLEAMSGSGRLQIPLLQRGYVIDGVDHSAAMLARCRQRCASLGLAPELYEQSLENLALPHVYNTVIIAVASLQLIIDHDLVLQALKNIHAHMLVGGNFLIDIFEPGVTQDDSFVSLIRLDEHNVIRLTKRHRFYVEKKLSQTFCLYELMVDGIVQQQENELVEFVWRSQDEWQALLLQAGFKVVRVHDVRFKQAQPSCVIHARAVAKNCVGSGA